MKCSSCPFGGYLGGRRETRRGWRKEGMGRDSREESLGPDVVYSVPGCGSALLVNLIKNVSEYWYMWCTWTDLLVCTVLHINKPNVLVSVWYFPCNRLSLCFMCCLLSAWIVFHVSSFSNLFCYRFSFFFSHILIRCSSSSLIILTCSMQELQAPTPSSVSCAASKQHSPLPLGWSLMRTDTLTVPSSVSPSVLAQNYTYVPFMPPHTPPPMRSLRFRCSCYPTHSLDAIVWISHTSLLVTPPRQTHSAHIPTLNLPLIMCYLLIFFVFFCCCFDLHLQIWRFYLQESMKSRTESWIFLQVDAG